MNPITATLLVRDDRHILETIRQLRPHVREVVVGYTPNETLAADELVAAGAHIVVDIPAPLRNWAAARNAVMAQAGEPYVLWADSDDEFAGLERLPEALAMLEGAPLARLLCPYEYATDKETGAVTHLQWRERIVRNDGRFEWRYPCHETLVAKDGRYGDKPEPRCDFVVWKHRREEQPESLGQQLEMLREYEREHASDPWLLVNLGLTLLRDGQAKAAIPYLEGSVEKSGWDDDRAATMLELARAEQQVAGIGGDDSRAMGWLESARDLRPDWFEPHFEIGKLWYLRATLRGDERGLAQARFAYQRARECPLTDTVLPRGTRPVDRALHVHDYERQVCEEQGDWAGALAATEWALVARPLDPKLRVAKRRYEAALALEHAVAPTRAPSRLDIVFACGQSWRPWNPAVLEQEGLGGSETAVIEMAKRLRGMGHRVRVFCSSGGSGIYDGVEYRDTDAMREGESVRCDVLVAWRIASLLEFADARVRVAWAHDVELGEMTPKRALLADRVLALSEWHKANLVRAHGLDAERVVVTANGLDLGRFDVSAKRDPHRIVYSSSLDRGLQLLVDLWPDIRARVPDASLDVFYGADAWLATADESKNQQQRYAVHSLLRRLETTEGVTYHGRVDQRRLAREMLSAGVWAYPTWFKETSCIGAIEAQAAGLRIVTTPVAALAETVADRGVLVEGNWLSARFQAEFVGEVVRALTAPEGEWVRTREELQAYAREHFSWDGVAKEWADLFGELLRERERGEMPAYQGRR